MAFKRLCKLPKWCKESACQCRRRKRHSFCPWVRKTPCKRKWQPTPVFLLGESWGPRNLVVYSPWGRQELDTTEWPTDLKACQRLCTGQCYNLNNWMVGKCACSLCRGWTGGEARGIWFSPALFSWPCCSLWTSSRHFLLSLPGACSPGHLCLTPGGWLLMCWSSFLALGWGVGGCESPLFLSPICSTVIPCLYRKSLSFLPQSSHLSFICQLSSISIQNFSSVQLLGGVRLFVTPWIAALQASLSITNSRSSLRLTSIESVMPSSHLILCWFRTLASHKRSMRSFIGEEAVF